MSKHVDILNNSFHIKLIYTIVFTINIGVYIDVNFKEIINIYIIKSLISNIYNFLHLYGILQWIYNNHTLLHPRDLMSVYVYVYYMHDGCSYLMGKEDFEYPTLLLSIWLPRNMVSHWSWSSPFLSKTVAWKFQK